eukprot:TRINITY_DN25778_c0_g1_i1.p1 TRINITY_DN25778_c0_g1~~TRINITY_DN25778_c0_g1_i1.p1  ORF type:complete len:718 (+),score=83.28 TRINITY_DN25778_c0_g1_i1:51-2156(+)
MSHDDVSMRSRNVTCRGSPSATAYRGELCPPPHPQSEERCDVPFCAALLHEWNVGVWSSCGGSSCGIGLRTRTVSCRFVDGGEADEQFCNQMPMPSKEKPCTLLPCASYRLINRAPVQRNWHVMEIGFYVDDRCTQLLSGQPFGSDHCQECHCPDASGVWGACGADLAFVGYTPQDINDSAIAGSSWISECGQSQQCGIGQAWLGIHVNMKVQIRCLRLMQIADVDRLAREVALEAWTIDVGSWTTVAEWTGLVGGGWESLVVPRFCSDFLDCSNHGRARGLPGSCICVCRPGYRGVQCDFCDYGFGGYPECQPRIPESSRWRLVALGAASSTFWHVADVRLYTDISCRDGFEVAVDDIVEYLVSSPAGNTSVASSTNHYFQDSSGPFGVSSAGLETNRSSNGSLGNTKSGNFSEGILDAMSAPHRAFDSQGASTVWVGPCGGGPDCIGNAWIGVRLRNIVQVRCLRFTQGPSDFAVNFVALDLWKVDTSSWRRVRSWNDIGKREAGLDVYENTRIPTLLRVVCDQGLPSGANTRSDCAPGDPLHDTFPSEGLQPWDVCVARCEEGYVGSPTRFVCTDSYEFAGVLPNCVPSECTRGVPNLPEVYAADCAGRRTNEVCSVRCADGFLGTEVSYVCAPDGLLREKKSLRADVVPSCQRDLAGMGDMSNSAATVRLRCVDVLWEYTFLTSVCVLFAVLDIGRH